MLEEDISFLVIVFLCRRNRPGIDNSPRVGIHRIRTIAVNHSTVRECRLLLEDKGEEIPQILSGASSSRRMG